MNTDKISFSESDDFLVSVISSAPYGILTIDWNGEITIANYLAREYLGLKYEVKELPGKNILDCVDHIGILKKMLRKTLKKNKKAFNLETILYDNQYLNFKLRVIHNGFLLTVENITRLKDIEAAALNSTFEGQELERKRLAKEIHDGLGPLLSTVKLTLETVVSELKQKDNASALQKLENTSMLIDSITGDLRNISRDLMPTVLEDFGLVAALENLCRRLDEANKLKVNFYSSGMKNRFEKNLELGLYRIGQELVNNAIKHSGGTTLNFQLIRHKNSIVLMVEDNGTGFNEEAKNPANHGIGLINIEARTKALGGEFFIDSSEGRGVIATVEIPLMAEKTPVKLKQPNGIRINN
jgi:PAS domain S-box-containing protein